MKGDPLYLCALAGAFLIAGALHSCTAEARPGDYTKRACARGSAKACVRLCERGFPGYCGSARSIDRKKNTPRNVGSRRYIYRERAADVPFPAPRVPLFEEPTELEGRMIFAGDDAVTIPADAPTFRVDDAFDAAAEAPLVPYRVRKLAAADMERLAEQWQVAERLPIVRLEEPQPFDWRPIIALVAFGLSIAIFRHAMPDSWSYLTRARPRRRRRIAFFDI